MTVDEAKDFNDLFIEIRPALYTRVVQLLGDPHEAEEVVQEVYLKISAQKARQNFESHPNKVAYLLVTAKNIIRDSWRRRQRLSRTLALEQALDTERSHDGGLQECEDRLVVAALLSSLTAREAAAIRLVDIESYSLEEAGLLLGVHWGTVHRNRQRGLRQLRAKFDGIGSTGSRQVKKSRGQGPPSVSPHQPPHEKSQGEHVVKTSTAPMPTASERDDDPRTPLNRLTRLLDPGSPVMLHEPDEIATTTVRGQIDGLKVIAFCTDATRRGGALGLAECARIAEAIDLAAGEGCPIIGLWHSGGAKIGDGIESMHGIGQIFAAMIRASGVVPQISVVLGPAAGGAAYGPALTDLVIMAPAGRIFVTGPDVVSSVTGEKIDMEGLGGAEAHGRKSGVAHVTAESEDAAFDTARRLADLLGRPGSFRVGAAGPPKDLRALLPESPRRAYDVRPLVHEIVDDGDFLELQPKWAANVVIGLGRLGGGTVGVIANNPLRKGGCLDSLSAEKSARFVRMCDCAGIPLIVLVDVPGYLPGVGQEWSGVVRRGAKLLYAFAEARVPRVTLVTRKSYGGAYIAMNSRSLGATAIFAWPEAEVGVMGAESAVRVLHWKKIAAVPEDEREPMRARLIEQHREANRDLDHGVRLGVIDGVIDPSQSRVRMLEVFAAQQEGGRAGRGKHGNIPL
ncbi:sigma-70 family RNA polymerase sigma factor [Actinoallomurus sp. NBC_01490]|uniref:sigma-70 family RNA polymerase sigma factor n=1 Tax=Actinoallomurus sp. NBC_01490 TaxID=2903557 RepID=UPI003FA4C2F5